jgi:hypothetical protein
MPEKSELKIQGNKNTQSLIGSVLKKTKPLILLSD